MPVTQDYISELERRHGNTPELQELKRRYIPESNIGIDDLDSEHQEKIRDTLFYSIISDSDPNDVFPYIKEIKQNEKGSRYEDFSKRLSSGLASVGSAIANYASKQGNYYIPSSGGIAPILPKQEEKIQKITQEGQRELAKSADFLWRIANDPSLAMTHNDLFAKASGMIAETLTYILATTAGGLMAGPAGAFGVGAMVEGNNTYRSAQDYFREQNGGQPLTQEQEIKAQKIGVAGGLAKGAIEGVGFGSVSKLFNIVSGKLKSKLLIGAVDFTAATISEALEEGSQELVDVGLEKTYKDVDWNEAVTRTLGAMAGGAFLGGAVKGGGIAFQQSMLMANEKPAKIPEEYLVKEDDVSQPTESVTQTEPTTTNVTQAPTPAVEPQTMAEGEVVEPKIGDLVELEKNVFKQIDEKDIINEKDGTITFKYPDRNGKEISKTVKFGEVNFVKPPETSIPINRVESLKTYAPSWLTGELLDKWSKGEITDEDVVSTVLDKNAKTPEQKALLRNKNMEERFLDNGARIIYFPDLNKEFNIGTGSHIDALDRARQEAYGDLQKTKDIVDSLFQPTPPVSEPQTPADAGKGMLEGTVVSDLKGNPIVVYHGTDKQFDTFGGSEHGLYYFTEKEDYAKKYAHDKGLVKKAFLNIKNPLEISDFDLSENYTTLSNFVEELEYASNNKTFAESVKNEWEATYGEEDEFFRWEIVATQEFRDLLIKYGYDGIRASEGFTNIWVTVSPEQIIENKSSFTPPVEVQPEKVKTERVPQEIFPEIQGEGETKVRGLAKSISDMMDNEDLRLAAADETYQVSSQKKRLNENAAVLVVNEPDRAKRIALAQEAPNTKDGVFPEDVYTALRNKARIEGDVDTQIQLMKSPIAKSATEMGRRIQALDTGEERDPVRAGQDLIAAKEKAFEKKTGKKVKEAVKKEAKKIKKKVKETMLSKQDWHDFIASLQC